MESLGKYRLIIETSRTPIYQRIIEAFIKSFKDNGHEVMMLNSATSNIEDYINTVNNSGCMFCVITNPVSLLSTYIQDKKKYAYEFVNAPIIFIHHDNIFSSLTTYEAIHQKISSFYRVRDKSYHFCIEYFNFLDLRNLGIENTYCLTHASEYSKVKKSADTFNYDISFVGHVLPQVPFNFADNVSHLFNSDFWNRICQLDTKIEPTSEVFASKIFSQNDNIINWYAAKYLYISMLHLLSQPFRGEILKRTGDYEIDIFGGDPAYLHGKSNKREIKKPKLSYNPPTADYSATRNIYATSKINLNITSLQFDEAVINRIFDVAAAGGFILTDWKSNLRDITSVHKEISYKTIDEMNAKLEYYLSHEKERQDIAEQLHKDVSENFTYSHIVKNILSKVCGMSNEQEKVRLDLGCGSSKSVGFIGIDIKPGPGVDVTADLSKRFPYPDNHVDEIKAHDIIEHLPDRIHTMNEMWRICKPGAIIDIRVPSTDGRGAFQDPTHVSFWNINSFKYYCVEYQAYLALAKKYGFSGGLKIISLVHEEESDKVIHVRAKLEVIKGN